MKVLSVIEGLMRFMGIVRLRSDNAGKGKAKGIFFLSFFFYPLPLTLPLSFTYVNIVDEDFVPI